MPTAAKKSSAVPQFQMPEVMEYSSTDLIGRYAYMMTGAGIDSKKLTGTILFDGQVIDRNSDGSTTGYMKVTQVGQDLRQATRYTVRPDGTGQLDIVAHRDGGPNIIPGCQFSSANGMRKLFITSDDGTYAGTAEKVDE